jgi:hypothetical protein
MSKGTFNPMIIVKDQVVVTDTQNNSLVECHMGPDNKTAGVFVTSCGC